MNEPLLRTKLFVPPVRPNRLGRPRLYARLDAGLDKALVLISAPAGYGKTTLVSSWLQENNLPAAWLSLDDGDNDPHRFQQNFTAALQTIVPAIHLEDQPSRLQEIQLGLGEAALRLLLNQITESTTRFVLVLDDVHLIHAQPIFEKLAFLIEHMPPQMHLTLLSRTDPALPLARLRARDQLVEIRAEQLRFTTDEIAEFLNAGMGLRLSVADLAAMEARTEGWIAGLQLAALSMQGCKDIPGFVSAFTGSHYYIMDYLTEEVLKLQPESVSAFLLQTSILASMCGSLCDALIDRDGASAVDGQAMLETLDQMNLFVIALDDQRQWYRYHHLFGDVLHLRLERQFPQQKTELHRRASHWYEQNGIITEAIQHALAAKDQARAARLVEEHGCSVLMRGEGFTLLRWVEAVESFLPTHPWLAILKAWGFALTGSLERIEPTLQMAEGLLSSIDRTFEVRVMLGSMAAVRAYLANQYGATPLAVAYASQALEDLPEGNDFSCSLRGVARSILGDASWLDGDLEGARQAYLEASRTGQEAGNADITLIANGNLADVLTNLGHLNQAARIYASSLQIAARPDGQKLPLADRLYAGLGRIYYEWNRLEEASQSFYRCIDLCQQWGNSFLLGKAYVMRAWLEAAWGNSAVAHQAIQAAESLLADQRLTLKQSLSIECAIARWWITQGRLEPASDFVQRTGLTAGAMAPGAEIPYAQEAEYVLLLRLLLAQGNPEAALSLAERLLRLAQASKHNGRVIELSILQAFAFQAKKDMAQALRVLDRALLSAQPEGYIRVFLDEGEPLAKLLYHAKSHHAGRGYESELILALGKASASEPPAAQLLIEPLTGREIEVLKLIAAGDSNLEIADELVISLPTVKRHISNIYAKMGVKNRTQSVSLGKALGLIED